MLRSAPEDQRRVRFAEGEEGVDDHQRLQGGGRPEEPPPGDAGGDEAADYGTCDSVLTTVLVRVGGKMMGLTDSRPQHGNEQVHAQRPPPLLGQPHIAQHAPRKRVDSAGAEARHEARGDKQALGVSAPAQDVPD